VLAAYAAINVALTAVCMGGGKLGLYAMFGTFFFMSVMFPTIFALGIRGLGDHTKLGSSLIVMSIVGGAIAAPFMGHIADVHSMRMGIRGAAGVLCVHRHLRLGLAEAGSQGRGEGLTGN
jgi:MFS transporter, FHS family, L-fucose permease